MLLPLILALNTVQSSGRNVGLFVGTYTTGQQSKGIYGVQLNTDTGALSNPQLAGEARDPSYLAIDGAKRFLYAVDEGNEGAVVAFSIGSDMSLHRLNSRPTNGSAPCHLTVTPGGKSVLVANYTSGNVISFPVMADGSLGPSNSEHQNQGRGPNRSRQEGPHMHAIYIDRSVTHAFACDLGTDELLVYPFDRRKGSADLTHPTHIKMAGGSGPRHGAMDAKGKCLYVCNELSNSVSVFEVHAAAPYFKEIQNIPTLPEAETSHGSRTAEIVLHPNGKWLYVSNRGHDSIAVFSVGSGGKLTLVEIKDLPLKEPRGFDIDPTGKWLVVAGQSSNDLTAFALNRESGEIGGVAGKVSVSAPVCVLFAHK